LGSSTQKPTTTSTREEKKKQQKARGKERENEGKRNDERASWGGNLSPTRVFSRQEADQNQNPTPKNLGLHSAGAKGTKRRNALKKRKMGGRIAERAMAGESQFVLGKAWGSRTIGEGKADETASQSQVSSPRNNYRKLEYERNGVWRRHRPSQTTNGSHHVPDA